MRHTTVQFDLSEYKFLFNATSAIYGINRDLKDYIKDKNEPKAIKSKEVMEFLGYS